MLRILGLAALIALASGCATETGATRSHQRTPNQASTSHLSTKHQSNKVADVNDPNVVRCEYIERLGTRFGTRVCMTNKDWQAHWKQTANDSRQALEHAERIGAQVDAGNGNGQ